MCVQVLDFRTSFAVWRSVHFFGHLAIAGEPASRHHLISLLRISCAWCCPVLTTQCSGCCRPSPTENVLVAAVAITMYAVVFPPKRPKKPVELAGKNVGEADGAVAAHGSKEE